MDDKEIFTESSIDKQSKNYKKIKKNDIIILKRLLHLKPNYFKKFKKTFSLHMRIFIKYHIDTIDWINKKYSLTISEKIFGFIWKTSNSARAISIQEKKRLFSFYSDKEPPFYIFSLVYEMHRFLIEYVIPLNEPINDTPVNLMAVVNKKCNIMVKLLINIIITEECYNFDKRKKKSLVTFYEKMIDFSMVALMNNQEIHNHSLEYFLLYLNKFPYCCSKKNRIREDPEFQMNEDQQLQNKESGFEKLRMPDGSVITLNDQPADVFASVVPCGENAKNDSQKLASFTLNYKYRFKKILNDISITHFIHCNYIHKELNNLLNEAIKKETQEQKERRIDNLFSSINGNSDYIFNEIINPLQKTINYLQEVNSPEYEWFKYMVITTEYIPVSITISTAKKKYFGFPLLYVNRQFEKDTGYMRESIIGHSCKFMQPIKSISDEKVQHRIITNSLKMPTPVCVIVTNIRYDGSSFYNLLSLNPIVDFEGNYLYVIGIQTPITTDYSTLDISSIQNVIDLMYILT